MSQTKMMCLACNVKTKVIDSRLEHGRIHRRRICPECSARFSSFELAAVDYQDLLDDRQELIDLKRQLNQIFKQLKGAIEQ